MVTDNPLSPTSQNIYVNNSTFLNNFANGTGGGAIYVGDANLYI